MKVILLQDIPKLGKKYDVKEVNDGHARNFLLPKGLAKPATATALETLSKQKIAGEQKHAEEKTRYENISEALERKTFTIKTKIGERGKAFGAVSASRINDALKKENIPVEKEWISLDQPIKKTGEVVIPVKFPHGVTGKIKINVIAE